MDVMKDIKFVTDTVDATGYGRIIYKQRYFGLPMELVEYIKALHDQNNDTELVKMMNRMP